MAFAAPQWTHCHQTRGALLPSLCEPATTTTGEACSNNGDCSHGFAYAMDRLGRVPDKNVDRGMPRCRDMREKHVQQGSGCRRGWGRLQCICSASVWHICLLYFHGLLGDAMFLLDLQGPVTAPRCSSQGITREHSGHPSWCALACLGQGFQL